MSDSLEKNLIAAVSSSWNENAPALLGCSSTLSLLAAKEVSGEGMSAALAVAMTWSAAFAVPIMSGASGVLICLFKSEECEEIDRLIKQPSDGLLRPGGRSLINAILQGASTALNAGSSAPISFGNVNYIDLTIDETRLAAIVRNSAHIGTFSLTVGSEIMSQALLVYAPEGVLETAPKQTASRPAQTEAPVQKEPQSPQQQSQPQPQTTRRNSGQRRLEAAAPRNIERLLDVELDVIVRFGITNVPLRDVVRMGVGTMIELNRAVDEPVELLVNGRPLARGEVVVVDGYYGVRITEIGPTSERAAAIL